MRKKNVFGLGSDNEDDETKEVLSKMRGRSNVNYMLEKMNHSNKIKMVEQANKYLMEDPTIYDYDGFHEDINRKRQQLVEKAKKERGESRYLDQLKDASEKRKREQSIIHEKMAEKELQRDDTNYGKKEKFVTESYRKVLEANKAYEEEVKTKEVLDSKHTVENKKNMNEFWKNMFDQNVFNGMDRPDINSELKQEKAQAKLNELKYLNADKAKRERKNLNENVGGNDERKPSRSRSRSRSLSKEKYETNIKELENYQKELELKKNEEERLERERKEKEELERKILEEKSRVDKALSAKERYLMRKTAAANTVNEN